MLCLRILAVALLLGGLRPAPLRAAGTVQVQCVDTKDQPVADAVVWLTPLDAAPVLAPPAEPLIIEQQDQEFRPYVTPVVVGTRISFPNRDTVQHRVYSVSKPKHFEIPLYRGEAREPVLFDQPGLVTIGCNIHDWMIAYVMVLATPDYAKSAGAGIAVLSRLPPGHYRLEVWHPRLAAGVTRAAPAPALGRIRAHRAAALARDRTGALPADRMGTASHHSHVPGRRGPAGAGNRARSQPAGASAGRAHRTRGPGRFCSPDRPGPLGRIGRSRQRI
jgi:plastocyanin